MLEGIQLTEKFRAYLIDWAKKVEDEKHREKFIESLTYAKSDRQLEKLAREIDKTIEDQ